MIKHFTTLVPIRYVLAIFTAMTLFLAGTGLSPATATEPETKTATATVENTTVTSETDAGAVGLTLPGTLTNQPQVSLAEVPEEYLEATKTTPTASTKLPYSAISSYETNNGTQTLIRIDSHQAAKEYRFPLELPERATAELTEDGSILIKDANGKILGGYKTPWAIDTNGTHVPTRFTLDGDTLIQTINFTPETAFPIVADPNSWWGWTECSITIGIAVTTNALLASKIAKIGGVARAVNLLRNARTWKQRLQALKHIFGELSGLTGIITKCILN